MNKKYRPQSLKNKVIKDRLKGNKLKYLSDKYSVSFSTIVRWMRVCKVDNQ